MHDKFDESNTPVKNVVEINFLGEDIEKISLNDSPAQEDEDKSKDNINGEVQDVKVESTQPLPKDWRYVTSHTKELIIGNVSKWVTSRSNLHDICGHFVFISHIEPKNIIEAKGDSYWLLAIQEELNQFERNQI